jgi:hypothetical protein
LAAVETVRKYGAENTILLNHDISPEVEHKDIKRFKQEVADYLEIPITYANMDGWETTTPLDIAIQKACFKLPNQFAYCTYELKTRHFYKYLEKHPINQSIKIIYGFDANEPDRISRKKANIRAMGYTTEFPLAEWPRTIEQIEDIGIQRPITYKTFKHANCIGCLKAGRQHWYCVYCLRPDIWEKAKAAEEQIGYSIIKGVYLKDLEVKFKEMRDEKNIYPNDIENSATFWARVNKELPGQETLFPCDCSF